LPGPWTAADDWCGEHPARQRDRLAATLAQGMLSDESAGQGDRYTDRAEFARRAYGFADALIAESEREGPDGD
jgi:hypothetical protein